MPRSQPWTMQEDCLLSSAVNAVGTEWEKVANVFNMHTAVTCLRSRDSMRHRWARLCNELKCDEVMEDILKSISEESEENNEEDLDFISFLMNTSDDEILSTLDY